MKLIGFLVKVTPPVSRGEKNFTTQEVIVDISDPNSQFQTICALQLSSKNIGIADNIPTGTRVECSFGIRGYETKNGRVFNNLNLYRITPINGVAQQPTAPEQAAAPQPQLVPTPTYQQPVYQQPVPYPYPPQVGNQQQQNPNEPLPF